MQKFLVLSGQAQPKMTAPTCPSPTGMRVSDVWSQSYASIASKWRNYLEGPVYRRESNNGFSPWAELFRHNHWPSSNEALRQEVAWATRV